MTTKFDSKKFWKYAGFYGILVLLAFLRALGTYVFIVPNAFAPGGVGGIASVVYNLVARYDMALADTWFNPAVTVFRDLWLCSARWISPCSAAKVLLRA